jgi:hypothetical protein
MVLQASFFGCNKCINSVQRTLKKYKPNLQTEQVYDDFWRCTVVLPSEVGQKLAAASSKQPQGSKKTPGSASLFSTAWKSLTGKNIPFQRNTNGEWQCEHASNTRWPTNH